MAQNLGNLFIDGEDVIEDENSTHSITNTNTVIDTNIKKYGESSIYFDGTSTLQLDDHTDFDLRSYETSWTIDFWSKTNGAGNGYWVFHIGAADYATIAWSFYAGKHTFFCDCQSTPANLAGWNVIYGPTVGTEWIHCAVVYNSEDTSIRMYCDGVEVGIPLNINGDLTLNNNILTIGEHYEGGYKLVGNLDNFRLTKGEVLWTSNFNINDSDAMFYTPVPQQGTPYIRPDNIAGLYGLGSRGNLRGKASEGLIRPTMKQFFTSENFEEIVARFPSPDSYVWQTWMGSTDPAMFDYFGGSIAVDGDTMVVGAFGKLSYTGAAYVFRRTGTTWTFEKKLVASDFSVNAYYAVSVAISGDTIAIGAKFADPGGLSSAGQVYVYTRDGGTWPEQTILSASDKSSNDNFGLDVSIDGDTLAVCTNQRSGTPSGRAYILNRVGSIWTETQILQANDAVNDDRFGSSISIRGDKVIVGCMDRTTSSTNDGCAYVFGNIEGTWTQEGKLLMPSTYANDKYGWAVDIYKDTAVMSGLQADPPSNAGGVGVFVKNNGTWSFQQKIVSSDLEANDQFGKSIAVYEDILIVGAHQTTTAWGQAGTGYYFTREDDVWTQKQILPRQDPNPDYRANFGSSVGISSDGSTVVVGADTCTNFRGNAYVYIAHTD